MFLLYSFSQNSGYFSGDAKSTTRFAYSLTAEKKKPVPRVYSDSPESRIHLTCYLYFRSWWQRSLEIPLRIQFSVREGFLGRLLWCRRYKVIFCCCCCSFFVCLFVCFFQEAAGLFRNQRIWNFATLSWNLTHTPNHKTWASSCNA